MRVAVTREELVPRLAALGHDVVLCELIRFEPLGDEPVDGSGHDWVVVTSPRGADELARRGVTANRIAAIGPSTAEALRAHGLHVDLVADTHTQEGLRDVLPPGETLLLAAAEGARRDVLDADFLPLYRTLELPQEVDADLAVLTSASNVRALRTRMPVVAIGPQTAAEAQARGFEVVAVANPHTLDGLVEAVASLRW
jgi:uroporphyrinogen-III synthase